MMKRYFELLLFLVCVSISQKIQAQQTESFYFNSDLGSAGGTKTLTETLSCNAAPGSFGTVDINTSSGFCSNSTAFCFNEGGGLVYPNGDITGEYSINLFFKFNSLSGYSRIIDFSNSSADAGIYLYGNCLNFFPNGNVGACNFSANLFYLFTFVRNGTTNQITIYVNGTPFGTFSDAANRYRPASINTPLIFFRDDNVVRCEDKPGCIKYLSVSPEVLNAAQVDSIWQNICGVISADCRATVEYPASPFCASDTLAQLPVLTGNTSGTFQSTGPILLDPHTGAVNASASTAGDYRIYYMLENCPADAVYADVIVSEPVPAPAGLSPQSVCSGAGPGHFDVQGENIIWYDSETGGELLDPGTELIATGSYFAAQVIDGCESISRTQIVPKLEAPFLVDITPVGLQGLCEGDSIRIVTNGEFSEYLWTPGGYTSGEITVRDTGEYILTVRRDDGCKGVSRPVHVIARSIPVAGFSDVQVNGEYSVNMINESLDGDTYYWDFGYGTSTTSDPSFNFPYDGTFPVKLIVTNPCGADTLTRQVVVSKTGISGFDRSVARLFPNPVSDLLVFEFQDSGTGGFIEIIDYTGQLVWSGFSGKRVELDVHHLSSGIYLLRMQSGAESAALRFVKQ